MWTESLSGETGGIKPVLLIIRGAEWRFSIVDVARAGSTLLIRIVLTGPEDCEVLMRISGEYIVGVTAKQILDAACAWLQSRGPETQGVIDVVPTGVPVRRQRFAH